MNKTAMNPDPVDIFVGRRVRFRRTMLGLSQTDLSKCLGITFQQIQKYERGTNRIGASRLKSIADCLKVDISFFFEGLPSGLNDGGPEPAASDNADHLMHFLASPEAAKLTVAFAKIPSGETRRRLLKLVTAISEEFAADVA